MKLIPIWTPDAGHGYLVNRMRGCRDESVGSMGWFRAMRSHAMRVGGDIVVPTIHEARDFMEEASDLIDPTLFFVGHAGNAAVVGFFDHIYDASTKREKAERDECLRNARMTAESLSMVSDPYSFSAVVVLGFESGTAELEQAIPFTWRMRCVPQ